MFSLHGALLAIGVAQCGALRQLVVLKSGLCQVFSNGGHRWVLRQGAQPDGVPTVIFAKYRWKLRNYLHG